MANANFQKYTISLDAVEASLLPINYQSKYDNVAPLWTTNNLNMRNNDYYEFEVKNVDTKFNDDEEDEILNIPCHICNIDVPVPFLKQHQDSFRHIVNMKIADTAMERLKKSMHHYHYGSEETYPTLHFCPACVTVIKLKDKSKHEKSLAHTNSLIVNKFLNDFYILYTNNTNCDSDNVNLDKNFHQFNDQEVIKSRVINDNVDHSIDSISFTSATDSSSIFKDTYTEMSERNKDGTNGINSDNVKINNKNKDKMKKHNNTSNMLSINVSNRVGDKNEVSNLLSSVDDAITVKDASKKVSEVMKTESSKTKKANSKIHKLIAAELKYGNDKNRSTDSLSFLGDDFLLDASETIPVVVKTENSTLKKTKTKPKQYMEQDLKQEQDINRSMESLLLLEDDFTLVYSSKHNKIKKSKLKTNRDIIEGSIQEKDINRSMESLSFLRDDSDLLVEDTSKPVPEVTKPGKKQKDNTIKNKSKEINTIKDLDQENVTELCKICKNNENKDHSICIFLLKELSERYETGNKITAEFSGLYYHLIFKCNSPYCMVCKVNFYGAVDIITHLLSKEHMNSYRLLLGEHFLTIDNNFTTCNACNVKFRKDLELLHCEDIKHITKQEKYKRQLGKINAMYIK